MALLSTEQHLIAALGARDVSGWSPAETALTRELLPIPRSTVLDLLNPIRTGRDPLGDAFCALRLPDACRPQRASR